GRTAVQLENSGGVDDAVRSYLLGVFVLHVYSGLCACADDEGRPAEVFTTRLFEGGGQRGHNTSQGNAVDLVRADLGMPEKIDKQDAVLVRQALLIGGQPPARTERLAVVQADGDLGVSDV